MDKKGHILQGLFLYSCVFTVVTIGILAIVGSDGGGGGGGGNSCTGSVPCLQENFGGNFYEFKDQFSDPAFILSDGKSIFFAGIYYNPINGEPNVILITGPVTSCYDANMINGAIDWNKNYELDEGEFLEPMNGRLKVCNDTLSVFDLFLLGESWHHREWTYVGSSDLIKGTTMQKQIISPRDHLHDLLQLLEGSNGHNK